MLIILVRYFKYLNCVSDVDGSNLVDESSDLSTHRRLNIPQCQHKVRFNNDF